MEAITFTLGGETYALESRFAFEVFKVNDFSRIPGAQSTVFGLTVWRGELLTILDVRSILGLRTNALNDLTRIIVLGEDTPQFGILADKVHEMVTIPEEEIDTPPPSQDGSARSYVSGITKDAVIVLDAVRLLTLQG